MCHPTSPVGLRQVGTALLGADRAWQRPAQAFLHAAAIGMGTTGTAEVMAAGLGGGKPPCPEWKMLMGQGHMGLVSHPRRPR